MHGAHRDLYVLTHSSPSRRSSDLYGPRSYRFSLSPTQRSSGFYTVVFRYPEQEAAEAQAQAAMAQLAQLKAMERGAVKSALDIGVLEGTRNADYIMQGL